MGDENVLPLISGLNCGKKTVFYCSSCDPGATNCDGDCQWNYKFEKCVPNCQIDKNCNPNEKCRNEKCVLSYPNCRKNKDCYSQEECKDEKCVQLKNSKFILLTFFNKSIFWGFCIVVSIGKRICSQRSSTNISPKLHCFGSTVVHLPTL